MIRSARPVRSRTSVTFVVTENVGDVGRVLPNIWVDCSDWVRVRIRLIVVGKSHSNRNGLVFVSRDSNQI
jgi:hypothetical protein